MNGFCKASGKECFKTRALAERVARLYSRRKGKHSCSVYRCYYCKCYHLTSYSYQRCKGIEQSRKIRKFKYRNLYD